MPYVETHCRWICTNCNTEHGYTEPKTHKEVKRAATCCSMNIILPAEEVQEA